MVSIFHRLCHPRALLVFFQKLVQVREHVASQRRFFWQGSHFRIASFSLRFHLSSFVGADLVLIASSRKTRRNIPGR